MPTTRNLIFTAAILALATTSRAQTLSFSRADYATTAAPRGVTSADFNRDGALDLALVNTGRKSVAVLMNETGAGRGFVQRYEIVLGGGPFEVVAADLNRDSVTDLVVANADLNTIDVILGKAAGGFEAPDHIAAAGYPRGVAVDDVNFDWIPDIVYTQFSLNSVQILHGDGAGNFTARLAALPTGPNPQGVVIGQFRICCRRDIVVANTGARSISLFEQTATDVFGREDIVSPAAINVLAAADFNKDGRLDLAGASTVSNVVAVFRDVGSGFAAYGTLPTGASPRGIQVADLNGDGREEIITANRGSSTVTILPARADTSGWFVSPVTVAVGNGARDVVAGDFNFDGHLDLATANEYGSSSTVLTSVQPAPRGPFWIASSLASSDTYSSFVKIGEFNGNATADVLRSSGVLLDGTTFVPLTSGGTAARNVLSGTIGDFNADRRADVVLITAHSDGTYPQPIDAELFYGNGAGGFRFVGRFGSFGSVYDLTAGDFNRDGRTDIAVAGVGRPSTAGTIDIVLATAAGFAAQVTMATAPYPLSVTAADFDRDGDVDLAFAQGLNVDGVQLLEGDGTGRFTFGEFLAAPDGIYDVKVADLNHDGLTDIIGGGGSSLHVWLGSPSGTFGTLHSYPSDAYGIVIGDFTADGHVDVLAAGGQLLRGNGDGSFGEPEPINIWFNDAAAVDYDHDGRIDVVLVNYWHTMLLLNRAARGPNLAPVAIAGPDFTLGYEDQFGDNECDGNGASYDPNLDPLTYEWLDRNGRIVDTSGELCSGPLPPGTHPFTLIVRDAYGGQSTDSKTITVTPFKEAVVAAGYYATYGAWRTAADATASQGYRLWHPDAGAAKLNAPLANAVNYVDIWFLADPSQTYKMWIRMSAERDSWANDSIYVQFHEGALSGGRTRYQIGTVDALDINLEQCSGCGVSGWGWRDERWGSTLTSAPVLLRFPNGGWQQMRVQTREDGVSIDQVVFSSERYLNAPPGPPKRDNTILTPRP